MAFSGCKNENIEASDTGVTSSAAAYEPVILTRPEDGWSYNEVSQMLYIDGVNIVLKKARQTYMTVGYVTLYYIKIIIQFLY